MTPTDTAVVDLAAAQVKGQELERSNAALCEAAIVTIESAEAFTEAAHYLQQVAAKRKQVEEAFREAKTNAHKAHKSICALEAALLVPLDAIDRKVRAAVQTYTRAQEALRRAEEQRLSEEARKAEEARLLSEAAHLERQGQPEMAASVVEQALTAPAPVVTVAKTTPTVSGVTTVDKWSWRPINGDTDRAIQLLPREYLRIDETKVGAFARMHKGSAKLPGVEFFNEGGVRVRA